MTPGEKMTLAYWRERCWWQSGQILSLKEAAKLQGGQLGNTQKKLEKALKGLAKAEKEKADE